MQGRSRLWVITLLAILAGLSMYWVAWRSKILHAPGEPRHSQDLDERVRVASARDLGEKIYSRLDMRDIAEFESLEFFDSAVGALISEDLSGFASTDDESRRKDALNKLRHDIVGLMYYRWIQPSFEDYDRFMIESGYFLPDRFDDLKPGHRLTLQGAIRVWAGRELDETRSPREILKELWGLSAPGGSPAAHLQAVAIDGDGVEAELGVSCPGDSLGVTLDQTTLGPDAWAGASTVTIPRFYQSQSGWPHDLIQHGDCITVARVGIILRFANGEAYPFKFGCWYDNRTHSWYVYSVNVSNHKEDFGGIFF